MPVAMGYVPLGAAFGALVVQSDLPWAVAPVTALLVFAGSLEFFLVSLILTDAALSAVAVATVAINFRHVFYPLSYPTHLLRSWPQRLYGAFALTDETYAVLSTGARPVTARQVLLIQVFSHGYWVAGALLGVMVGQALPSTFRGLDFAITGLFIVLALEFFLGRRLPRVLVYAAVAILAGLIMSDAFLLVALTVYVGLCVADACTRTDDSEPIESRERTT